MRVILVSHCNLLGNSAIHVVSLAEALGSRGHEVAVLVPDWVEPARSASSASVFIYTYEEGLKGNFAFSERGAPDLVHCWTPREHVRDITVKLAKRFGIPYIVHMEDNENEILKSELNGVHGVDIFNLPEVYYDEIISPYRLHPTKSVSFLKDSAGFSALIDKLVKFKTNDSPHVVFWPGFEPEFECIDTSDGEIFRRENGIAEADFVVLFSGTAHKAVIDDIKNLYKAVIYLKERGINIKLLRTGLNNTPIDENGILQPHGSIIDLGFVDRKLMPAIISASDVLVQPGRSDEFNDFRFPSKLPEYLVSGKAVILSDANIGKHLQDRVQALKLYSGTLSELIDAIYFLFIEKDTRSRIGKGGREFALKYLQWSRAGELVEGLYKEVLNSSRRSREDLRPTDNSRNESKDTLGFSAGEVSHPVKLIAFYLPQFHPIPENNEWWGKGFTEWTNVSRAKSQMFGHFQPRRPTELGYYDLRVTENLFEQAKLASKFGIGGFCFYAYWFSGRRLLELPLNNWLERGPEFPFCICWANENWSRRWDGSESQVLMPQNYEAGFEQAFIDDMLPLLQDPRYIRVDGKPLLAIYRVDDFPRPMENVSLLRKAANNRGIPDIHLTAIQSFGISDPRIYGLDAAIEFSPPHTNRRLIDPGYVPGLAANFSGYLEDYVGVALESMNSAEPDYTRYRGCFPMWDNTARRGSSGHILINDSPKAYGHWLRFLVADAMKRRQVKEPLIFINAWNEWAEGAYLEPDDRLENGLLDITRAALIHGVADSIIGRHDAERERKFDQLVSLLPTLK